MPLTTIISGGQTGVDQGALRAALRAGLAVGGWCPPGRWSEAGPIPEEFPLRETPVDRSDRAPDIPRSLRTEWNVRDADGTLVLLPAGVEPDAGTRWTLEVAAMLGAPLLVVDPDAADALDRVVAWIEMNAIATLDVAGPSESTRPGIGERAESFVDSVLDAMR